MPGRGGAWRVFAEHRAARRRSGRSGRVARRVAESTPQPSTATWCPRRPARPGARRRRCRRPRRRPRSPQPRRARTRARRRRVRRTRWPRGRRRRTPRAPRRRPAGPGRAPTAPAAGPPQRSPRAAGLPERQQGPRRPLVVFRDDQPRPARRGLGQVGRARSSARRARSPAITAFGACSRRTSSAALDRAVRGDEHGPRRRGRLGDPHQVGPGHPDLVVAHADPRSWSARPARPMVGRPMIGAHGSSPSAPVRGAAAGPPVDQFSRSEGPPWLTPTPLPGMAASTARMIGIRPRGRRVTGTPIGPTRVWPSWPPSREPDSAARWERKCAAWQNGFREPGGRRVGGLHADLRSRKCNAAATWSASGLSAPAKSDNVQATRTHLFRASGARRTAAKPRSSSAVTLRGNGNSRRSAGPGTSGVGLPPVLAASAEQALLTRAQHAGAHRVGGLRPTRLQPGTWR